MGIWEWIVGTMRSYQELAIFLALAVGFWLGAKKIAGSAWAASRRRCSPPWLSGRSASRSGAHQVDVLHAVPVRRGYGVVRSSSAD